MAFGYGDLIGFYCRLKCVIEHTNIVVVVAAAAAASSEHRHV